MKSFSHTRLAILLVLALHAANLAQAQDEFQTTTWTGGAGNWFDSNQWTAGVPDGDEFAEITNGEASFDSEAHAFWLTVGPGRPTNEIGAAVGTADLVIGVLGIVGTSSGPGPGSLRTGNGQLMLTGADLRVLGGPILPDDPFLITAHFEVGTAGGTGTNRTLNGIGQVDIVDGDVIVPLGISVGNAGGTGTNNNMLGRGNFNLVGGTLTTQRLWIGNASGTGSANGTAVGEMTVTSGHIILEDSPLDADDDVGNPSSIRTSLSIGSSGGTGNFDGNATGTLRVNQGSVVADSITIGRTSPISQASGSSQGSLYLEDSNLTMMEMSMGFSSNNGGPASGLFQQIGGITTGNNLSLGPSGKIVLGIGGQTPGAGYSQVLVDNVFLDGSFEARFVDGFLPAPGDVFDLVVADNISGSYNFQITGINPADYPNLVVTRDNQLIRLAFVVPEPSCLALAVLSMVGFWVRSEGRRLEDRS